MAGAAALPEQINAFEQYFTVNCPPGPGPFIAVDEIMLSGLADRSLPFKMDIFREDSLLLALGGNLYGGVIRWVASPLQTSVLKPRDLRWEITNPNQSEDDRLKDDFYYNGHISYIDQSGLRHTHRIETSIGRLT